MQYLNLSLHKVSSLRRRQGRCMGERQNAEHSYNTQPLVTSISFHTHLLQEQHPRQQIKALTCCRIKNSFCPHYKGKIHSKSKVQGAVSIFTGLADSSLVALKQEVGCFYFHLLNRKDTGLFLFCPPVLGGGLGETPSLWWGCQGMEGCSEGYAVAKPS